MHKNNAINEVLQPGEVLDVIVDNAAGRGLLGIAIQPNFPAMVAHFEPEKCFPRHPFCSPKEEWTILHRYHSPVICVLANSGQQLAAIIKGWGGNFLALRCA